MMQAAVERQFEIIGEATAQLAKIDVASAELIPDYRRLIAFATYSSMAMQTSTMSSSGIWRKPDCRNYFE